MKIRSLSFVLMFIGLMALGVGAALGSQERLWHAYLLGYVYFVLLGLGGLFFVSIHHAVQAGWSVGVRRLAEAAASVLPWAAVLTLPLLYGAFYLYDWLDPAAVKGDPLLEHKAPYLNLKFFLIRLAVFFGGWTFFARKLIGFSLQQDKDGLEVWSKKSVKYSIAFLLFFALSLSFFSVDFLMSLDAHWFSTIFGVYVFAGLFQSVFALLILLSVYLMHRPGYEKWVRLDHLHDLGKFLLAAVVFWAYIAFSQYMLIWYANLPEETTFFMPRSKGAWGVVSVCLIVFKFIVPFLALLPRWVKRNIRAIVSVACLILFMELVDLYWLIYPHWSAERPYWGLLETALVLGFAGVFMRLVFRFLHEHSPVPLKDPRADEALSHKVTY